MSGPIPASFTLSVIVPMHNEQMTIAEILERVSRFSLTGIEVILVDDGSTDESVRIAERFLDRMSLTIIRHPMRRGKGAAVRTALQEVTGDYVLIQDADLEYNPEDWPSLLEPVFSGEADIVFGSRFRGGQPVRVLYFWHNLGNRILTGLSNFFTNLNLTDMEACYKLFPTNTLRSLTLKEDGFGFEPEVTARVSRLSVRIFEVGISYRGRSYEEGKKIRWSDGLRAIYAIVRYNTWDR
jgi:glycosyltransferase involved in cell wall biosynthesis